MPIINGDNLARIRDAVAPLDTEEHRTAYREGRFPRSEGVKDLDTRYRWDLYWAAGGGRLLPEDPMLREQLKTAHIDTALRSIVPPLKEGPE